MNDYGLKNLCAGIIERAIVDYIKALRGQRAVYSSTAPKDMIVECEAFFRSSWFSRLTDINPEWLIRHCKEKAKSKEPIHTLSLLRTREPD